MIEWIRTLRGSASTRLRSTPILVRPHPSRLAEWEGVDLSGLNAVLWGGNPVDVQSRADYFDTLYHSAAVVGINTSAFIEAGIVGRPVHTIVVPEMADNQTGTVHFNYLLNAGGGLLEVAHGFDEHLTKLEASLAQADLRAGLDVRREVKPFVREFVRPHGLDVAATPLFIDQIEAMRGLAVTAPVVDPLARVWEWAAARAAGTRDDERYERWTLSERELTSLEKLRGAREAKASRRADARRASDNERAARIREREQRHAANQRQRAEKAAEKARRLAEKRERVDAERAANRRAV